MNGAIMAVYQARAHREGRWWAIDIPSVDAATQARRVTDVEWMARECVALTLDVPEDDVEIDVHFVLPDDARAKWEVSRQKAEAARSEAAEAASLAREVVRAMRADGYTYAETASLLGVSPQRVHQLASAS
ncbi:hypothetical protein ASG04_14315 [Curtobacterium sp. Leaf183]|uniref:sigma-70 region 4 domain-containing protein n=1 Tax=Curtobacterium sp. Leaf183 TaxID=1736291 RepID=UPI0006F5B3FF|nr:sigma-70 region 4 domain-containing protein [Curtobacterium sp. Leaf183]KQS08279.1 hypothetical protein ASG04_14315 [Curtobacterium sp. Leaf183]